MKNICINGKEYECIAQLGKKMKPQLCFFLKTFSSLLGYSFTLEYIIIIFKLLSKKL